MAYLPPFPEAGEYLRYWDTNSKRTQYLEIVDKRAPLTYIRRLGSIASGGTGSRIVLPDLDPDRRMSHRYMAYVGVRPGAYIYMFHPFDFEQFGWDKRPADISFDLSRKITYEESPYDRPTVSFWIEPGRYPSFVAVNVMERTSVPEIYIVAAKYHVKEENPPEPANTIDPEIVVKLRMGDLQSIPIYFGGDI